MDFTLPGARFLDLPLHVIFKLGILQVAQLPKTAKLEVPFLIKVRVSNNTDRQCRDLILTCQEGNALSDFYVCNLMQTLVQHTEQRGGGAIWKL